MKDDVTPVRKRRATETPCRSRLANLPNLAFRAPHLFLWTAAFLRRPPPMPVPRFLARSAALMPKSTSLCAICLDTVGAVAITTHLPESDSRSPKSSSPWQSIRPAALIVATTLAEVLVASAEMSST